MFNVFGLKNLINNFFLEKKSYKNSRLIKFSMKVLTLDKHRNPSRSPATLLLLLKLSFFFPI